MGAYHLHRDLKCEPLVVRPGGHDLDTGILMINFMMGSAWQKVQVAERIVIGGKCQE